MALLRDIPGNRPLRASDFARAHYASNQNPGTTGYSLPIGTDVTVVSTTLAIDATNWGAYIAAVSAGCYLDSASADLRLHITNPSSQLTVILLNTAQTNNPAHRMMSGLYRFGIPLAGVGTWTFAAVLRRHGGNGGQFDANDTASVRIMQVTGEF